MLKESGDYVSGQELSERLHVSRSAVWKHIKALKEEGYVIDSVTNRGYLLKNIPELWNEQQVQENLKTLRLGRELLILRDVDSTNEELKRRARTDAAHGLVCVAEKQGAGKGRLGRAWSSPAGTGMWMSVLRYYARRGACRMQSGTRAYRVCCENKVAERRGNRQEKNLRYINGDVGGVRPRRFCGRGNRYKCKYRQFP